MTELNRKPDEWACVKPDLVVAGSDAQARNVLEMALQDIARLARVLTDLHHSVTVYQFSPNGCVDQFHAARDLEDAMDAATATLRRKSR